MPQSSRLFKFTAIILIFALLVTAIPAGAFGCGDTSPPAVQSEYFSPTTDSAALPSSLDPVLPVQGEDYSLSPEIASLLEQNDFDSLLNEIDPAEIPDLYDIFENLDVEFYYFVLMIDLTEAFGAGNEPTAAEMDAMLNGRYILKPYEQMQYPGQRVQVDVKHVPAACLVGDAQGKKYYQYTALDEFSRFRYLEAFEELSTSARRFF